MGSPANVITITVKCDLDLDEIYGRVHVYTSQEKSMDWVLDEFCKEKNVRRVSTFALRSGPGQDYDLTKTIAQCGLGDGDLIYCYNKNPPKPKPPPKTRQKQSGVCSAFLILGIAFLLIALAGIITIVLLHEFNTYGLRTYAVVVDAGSTSSKIYLYSWPSSLIFNTGKVQQDVYVKEVALSNFITKPSEAATPLIKSIRKNIIDAKKIPAKQIDNTPLYLGATAGMRMLRDRSPDAVQKLYQQLRIDLASLKLEIDNATSQIRIINGTEEGVDAWVTVNYLEGKLGEFVGNMFKRPKDDQTLGSLDLGGASTQIAFVPSEVNASSGGVTAMTLYGRSYDVYSHSFLCYGKTQAQFRLFAMLVQDEDYNDTTIGNPCSPKNHEEVLLARDFLLVPCTRGKHGIEAYGYAFKVPDRVKPDTQFKFVGLSDHASCVKLTERLFNSGASCTSGSCSFNGVYQPPLAGQFKAFAGFYHVANHFNATRTEDRTAATLAEFEDSVARYCARNWDSIKAQYGDSIYYAYYCFDGVYVQNLLQGYGFNATNWGNIDFVRSVRGNKVGWSLGFTLLESGRINTESLISLSLPLFIGLLVLFCLVFIVAVILLVMAWRNRRGRIRHNAGMGTDTALYGSI